MLLERKTRSKANIGLFKRKAVLEKKRWNRLMLLGEAHFFFRETFNKRNTTVEHVRECLDQPWPKPSPRLPNGLPPRVMNVPQKEVKEFLKKVVSRYKKTVLFGWVEATKFCFKHPNLEYVSDDEFNSYLNFTSLSQFLTNQFDGEDIEVFREFAIDEEYWCKADFSNTAALKTIDNCFAVACRVLFKKNDGNATSYDVVAIELEGAIYTNQDQSWPLVKAFALQNASIYIVLFQHSLVHFPLDAINAITKSLKSEHILHKFLLPHLYMQLPLDFAVNFVDKSVLHNHQKNIYTPFVHTKDSVYEFLSLAYTGVAGKKCFPTYQFPMEAPNWISEYGDITRDMYRTIYAFVAEVVKKIKANDEHVVWWADSISAQIPGFPNGTTILKEDNLTKALTSVILQVSWIHSADHYSYGGLRITKLPLRLRVAPPKKGEVVDLSRKALAFGDIFRHYLCNKMFLKTYTIKSLVDVEYSFNNDLDNEKNAFVNGVKELYARSNASRYIPIYEIATSIQS